MLWWSLFNCALMHIPNFFFNLVYDVEYGIIDWICCLYCLTIFWVAVGVWDFVLNLFLSSSLFCLSFSLLFSLSILNFSVFPLSPVCSFCFSFFEVCSVKPYFPLWFLPFTADYGRPFCLFIFYVLSLSLSLLLCLSLSFYFFGFLLFKR